MINWEDATSYSRGDKERIPSIWHLKVGCLRIAIHRLIRMEGWFVTCYALDIENNPLCSEDINKAKIEGLQLVIKKIEVLEQIKEQINGLI